MLKYLLLFLLINTQYSNSANDMYGIRSSSRFKINKKNKSSNITKDWIHLDPTDDNIQGISSYKAYSTFKEANDEVIVAIIDSGVDVNHKDLDGRIWINSNEIPNNNIDDDNNGYIDDIFGWNFLGSSKGNAQFKTSNKKNKYVLIQKDPKLQLKFDNLEITRIYEYLKNKSKNSSLSQEELKLFKHSREIVEFNMEFAEKNFKKLKQQVNQYLRNEKILLNAGIGSISYNNLRKFISLKKEAMDAKKEMVKFFDKKKSLIEIQEEMRSYEIDYKYLYNPKCKTRQNIVRDSRTNLHQTGYGNNNIIGPDSEHGTHVAGIIAANRNSFGVDGISSTTKLMILRVVPNGDERDKDVANAIYYAVNNGAKIINMSFGKAYSLNLKHVQKAIRFAEVNDVLIVNSAGNSNENNDTKNTYPSPFINRTKVTNWLTIGASGPKKNNSLVADFSNFGKEKVDFFAPGIDIYSTVENNKYSTSSGTSMAAPVVTAIAAEVLSIRNNFSPQEIIASIIEGLNNQKKVYIFKPGLGSIRFSTLSKYNGTPNLYKTINSIY